VALVYLVFAVVVRLATSVGVIATIFAIACDANVETVVGERVVVGAAVVVGVAVVVRAAVVVGVAVVVRAAVVVGATVVVPAEGIGVPSIILSAIILYARCC